MFGCLGRIGCLALLVVAAAAAWATRDRWTPLLDRETSVEVAAAPEWQPVTPAAAARARESVAQLAAPRGPVAVVLTPAEAAALVLEGVLRVLPESARDVEAAAIGDRLYVRADVALGELGGEALGPLAGMLGSREVLLLGGTLEAIGPGIGQFRVAEVKVREFVLPQRVVPRLLRELRRGQPLREGVAEDGIPLELPPAVADVRVSRGRVTLYEEVPVGAGG